MFKDTNRGVVGSPVAALEIIEDYTLGTLYLYLYLASLVTITIKVTRVTQLKIQESQCSGFKPPNSLLGFPSLLDFLFLNISSKIPKLVI